MNVFSSCISLQHRVDAAFLESMPVEKKPAWLLAWSPVADWMAAIPRWRWLLPPNLSVVHAIDNLAIVLAFVDLASILSS